MAMRKQTANSARRQQTERELQRTRPDYVIYTPLPREAEMQDGNNCGISVVEAADGDWVAVWEQVSAEQAPDGRLVLSRSTDKGRSWSQPVVLFGKNSDPKTGKNRICFAVAFRNATGRIYLLMNRSAGVADPHENGSLEISCSDDHGRSFREPIALPLPRVPGDNPNPAIPPACVPFLAPIRLRDGSYLGGVSHFFSLCQYPAREHWTDEESVCDIFRIENLEGTPDLREIGFHWTTVGKPVLRAPSRNNPKFQIGQEPSLAELPDGRVFCVFRTNSGSPWYSISADGGRSWQPPDRLLYRDGGNPVRQPLSPCPIFQAGPGEYLLFYHNHDGYFGPWGPDDAYHNRRPLYLSRGRFDAAAHQPIHFGDPELFMDNNGIPLGHQIRRADLAMYGSMSVSEGKRILWYPDRKYFLCGRIVPECPRYVFPPKTASAADVERQQNTDQ